MCVAWRAALAFLDAVAYKTGGRQQIPKRWPSDSGGGERNTQTAVSWLRALPLGDRRLRWLTNTKAFIKARGSSPEKRRSLSISFSLLLNYTAQVLHLNYSDTCLKCREREQKGQKQLWFGAICLVLMPAGELLSKVARRVFCGIKWPGKRSCAVQVLPFFH